MKSQAQKGMIEGLPRDSNRQAVLKTLLASKEPVKTRDLVGRTQAANPGINMDPKVASEVVQSAIREGLIDIAGEGQDLRIQLTPFGNDVAKNID